MGHNAVSTDAELSTVTSLRAFLCRCIAVSEKFTVHFFCRNVKIQNIFQVTAKQKDIQWKFLPASPHGYDSITKQSSK